MPYRNQCQDCGGYENPHVPGECGACSGHDLACKPSRALRRPFPSCVDDKYGSEGRWERGEDNPWGENATRAREG